MKSVCVFCGSNLGSSEVHSQSAYNLGAIIASSGFKLIYGGASRGLMGEVAKGALSRDGEVIGIMPKGAITIEKPLDGISQLITVDNVQDRKHEMIKKSDAFIALPGGLGTISELSDIASQSMCGFHNKPIALLNVNGYYTSFINLIDCMIEHGMMKPKYKDLICVSDNPYTIINYIKNAVS